MIPEAHLSLQECLGDQYVASKWDGPLDSASGAEGDPDAALAAVNAWHNKWAPDSPSDFCEVATTPNDHSQVEGNQVEGELLDLVTELKAQRWITGQPLILNELLDPKEEQEVGEYLNVFNGGDLEIIARVQAKGGNIEEIDSNSDDDQPKAVTPSLNEMIDACQVLEEGSLLICTDALDFIEAAHWFWGHLQTMSHKGTKQTTIDMFFNTK